MHNIHLKTFGFSRLWVPLLKCSPLHVQVLLGLLCVALWEMGLGTVQENADNLTTDIAMNHKVHFIQPKSLGLLPASLKLVG